MELLNTSEAWQKCSSALGYPHLSFSSRLPPVWSLQCNTTSSCHQLLPAVHAQPGTYLQLSSQCRILHVSRHNAKEKQVYMKTLTNDDEYSRCSPASSLCTCTARQIAAQKDDMHRKWM